MGQRVKDRAESYSGQQVAGEDHALSEGKQEGSRKKHKNETGSRGSLALHTLHIFL